MAMRAMRATTLRLAGALTYAIQPSSAHAALSAFIVDWGEVRADVAGLLAPDRDDHSLTPTLSIREPEFTRRTSETEARLCRQFGVQHLLKADAGTPLPRLLRVHVRHPRLTRPDGASSEEDSFLTAVTPRPPPNTPPGVEIGSTAAFFMFNYAWEMQPGAWTFEFRDGDALVASKTFTVTAPPDAPRQPECGPAAIS